MKFFQYLSTKVIVFATSSLLLISCEGSRPKRLYESGKAIYDDYEETGDPTWLIIFIGSSAKWIGGIV